MIRNLLLPCLLATFVLTACGQRDQPTPDDKRRPRLARTDSAGGMVFTIKPGISRDSALKFIAQKQGFFGGNLLSRVEFCIPCDSALFTINGLPTESFLVGAQTQGSGVKKPTDPSTGSTGEWGPLYYSSGFLAGDPLFDSSRKQYPPLRDSVLPRPNNTNQVVVAVIDTGIDSLLARSYPPGAIQNCIAGASRGWNFFGKNPYYNDNFGTPTPTGGYTGHGTPATRFILQQLNAATSIRVLPVKVLNAQGQCNLFQLMCGLAYAKRAGAKIINLSLGFYAPSETQVQTFKSFMDSIAKDSVIVIAAAGNADRYEDSIAIKRGEVSPADLRNLDRHLFFPAAFSKNNPNILTVTTVARTLPLQVAARQNFSRQRVQVGVVADADDVFLDPNGETRSWTGSSFAAPIVTGLVANVYTTTAGLFNAAGKLNQNMLFSKLISSSTPAQQVKAANTPALPRLIVTKKLSLRVQLPPRRLAVRPVPEPTGKP